MLVKTSFSDGEDRSSYDTERRKTIYLSPFSNRDEYTQAIPHAFAVLHQTTSLLVIKINNLFLEWYLPAHFIISIYPAGTEKPKWC